MLLSRLYGSMLRASYSNVFVFPKKPKRFVSLSSDSLVLVLYSTEYGLKRNFSVYIHISHNVLTFLELGFVDSSFHCTVLSVTRSSHGSGANGGSSSRSQMAPRA